MAFKKSRIKVSNGARADTYCQMIEEAREHAQTNCSVCDQYTRKQVIVSGGNDMMQKGHDNTGNWKAITEQNTTKWPEVEERLKHLANDLEDKVVDAIILGISNADGWQTGGHVITGFDKAAKLWTEEIRKSKLPILHCKNAVKRISKLSGDYHLEASYENTKAVFETIHNALKIAHFRTNLLGNLHKIS